MIFTVDLVLTMKEMMDRLRNAEVIGIVRTLKHVSNLLIDDAYRGCRAKCA